MKFDHDSYVAFARPLAQTVFEKTSIPIFFALLQSAHESAWGNSDLSSDDNNYFGMTKGSWTGEICQWPSTEEHALPPEKIHYWNRPGDIIEKKPRIGGGSILKVLIDFRKYQTPLDSFLDWGQHIKEGYPLAYAAAVKEDISGFIEEISKKYGTDSGYATSLIKLIYPIKVLLGEK